MILKIDQPEPKGQNFDFIYYILEYSWWWYGSERQLPILKVERALELLKGGTKVVMMVDVRWLWIVWLAFPDLT